MVQSVTKPIALLMGDAISTFTRLKKYDFKGQDVPCNLCGGSSRDVVGTRDRHGNKLSIVLCTHCGLVFANPMPTDEEVDAFYARHYRKHYHNAYEPRPKARLRAFKSAKSRSEFLTPILTPGLRFLDVGSGGGEVVQFMREQGLDAHGIEPNEGFAEYARATYGIPVQTTAWQDAQIEPESFDIVSANHVIEHFRLPFQAMVKFHEWLKPGGYFYVSVPDVYSPHRTPYARFHFAHLYYFNRESLIMMGLKAGFEVSDRIPGLSTTLVFRKTDAAPAEWFRYPDNYKNMARYFEIYTNRKYFLSLQPYGRWVRRMNRLGGQMLQATFVPGSVDREKNKRASPESGRIDPA